MMGHDVEVDGLTLGIGGGSPDPKPSAGGGAQGPAGSLTDVTAPCSLTSLPRFPARPASAWLAR